jgi:hypothetical protein
MSELLPIDPRSAEELTPGELQEVDENMFSPTARNRTNLRERCNADFNPRQQVVDFGAQAKSDFCRSRHAVDDFQLHAQDRLEVVTISMYLLLCIGPYVSMMLPLTVNSVLQLI